MAVLATECCEKITIYATAGDDRQRIHNTKQIPNYRGFALAEEIKRNRLDSGGIFTRQCLEFIENQQNLFVINLIFEVPISMPKQEYLLEAFETKRILL